MKTRSRHGDAVSSPTSITAAGSGAALPCTLGSSAFQHTSPHPLAQLRLRPASWSDDSLDDDTASDYDDIYDVYEARNTHTKAALTAPSPAKPPERPVGSITGIFGREVHLWAATPMFPPPAHQYVAGPSIATPAKAAPNPHDFDSDDQMSESDVAEWDSAPGSSSVHSAPPSEDEESSGELMVVDGVEKPESAPDQPETVSAATASCLCMESHPMPSQPVRRLQKVPSGPMREVSVDKSAPVVPTVHALAQEEEESEEEVIEPQAVVAPRTPPRRTQVLHNPETPYSSYSKETTTKDQPQIGDDLEHSAQGHEDAGSISQRGAPMPASATPEEEEEEESVPITRREDQAPPVVHVSSDGDTTNQEVPAVMMFGRRSSPARAVPLDRFTRGPKGKIPCTWTAPPGHRPCTRSFTRRADLDRHIATVHQMLNVSCAKCGATFSRQDALTRHQRDSCAALFTH